jgi:hypothetical protein
VAHWGAPCAAAWLFNPFTMAVSTRGNGEAIVLFMLLITLRLLRNGTPPAPESMLAEQGHTESAISPAAAAPLLT